MLDEQAKENVRKDIQTILKTAIVVDSTLDEYGSELCERLERTAEANTLLVEEILLLIGNDTEDYFLLKKERRATVHEGRK